MAMRLLQLCQASHMHTDEAQPTASNGHEDSGLALNNLHHTQLQIHTYSTHIEIQKYKVQVGKPLQNLGWVHPPQSCSLTGCRQP